ncbi:MAG: hypothetical protein ACUVTR_00935 [Dehalococcoidia bacterium]
MTNQEPPREFEDSLGLDSCLIGVKYATKPDARADRAGSPRHVKVLISSERNGQRLILRQKAAIA